MLFACCHPALSTASAIALTLRAAGGLTTAEIARAFLVPEATMAQRISRAKHAIATSNVPLEMPESAERAARLVAVMHVLYLIFNEGYTDRRGDLATEALRLVRLLPDEPEVAGLRALMLLTDARRDARTGPDGELVPLAEQDRARWDAAQIAEGIALVSATLPRGEIGAYQIQAAIAACHDEAARVEDTDWPQILALYEVLEAIEPGPMVTLNRAIALAMVRGPTAGLALVAPLDAELAHSHRLDAVRGHLLEQAGDIAGAIACYRRAAARTTSTAERDYLALKAAKLA
jgi:predicted RNA polymerase sigma factor